MTCALTVPLEMKGLFSEGVNRGLSPITKEVGMRKGDDGGCIRVMESSCVDSIPSGRFNSGDSVPPGTFHGGDNVPPGTFH